MHTGISQRARLYICSLLMPVFLHRYIAKAKPSTIPQAIMSPYQTIFSPSIPKRFSVAYRFKSFYRAFGEFCQSRGIRKPNYKSFALLFPLRRLHRRNRPMAAGNLFLRICIEFSFTHRYADMLPAFQAKRLSSSVLYDRVWNDTVFCGGAALNRSLFESVLM